MTSQFPKSASEPLCFSFHHQCLEITPPFVQINHNYVSVTQLMGRAGTKVPTDRHVVKTVAELTLLIVSTLKQGSECRGQERSTRTKPSLSGWVAAY